MDWGDVKTVNIAQHFFENINTSSNLHPEQFKMKLWDIKEKVQISKTIRENNIVSIKDYIDLSPVAKETKKINEYL